MKLNAEHIERRLALFLTALFLIPLVANSEVDLRTFAFIERAMDLDETDSSQIIRVYSSRSVGFGLFGLGWCTEWDTTLLPPKSGLPPRAIDCGEPSTRYRVRRHDTWFGVTDARDRLEAIPGGFVRHRLGLPAQSFDRTGRLVAILETQGVARLRYDSQGRLAAVEREHSSINFDRDEKGRVVRARSQSGALVEYRYRSDGLLASVIRNNQSVAYLYDDLRNLTQVTRPDGSWVSIEYDRDRDAVIRETRSNGCIDSYRLEPESAHGPSTGFRTQASRTCPSRRRQRISVLFCRVSGALSTSNGESC